MIGTLSELRPTRARPSIQRVSSDSIHLLFFVRTWPRRDMASAKENDGNVTRNNQMTQKREVEALPSVV
jgi:hypothetical protein